MLKKWNFFQTLSKKLKTFLPIAIILRLNPIEIPKMYKIEDPLAHIPMLMRGYSSCCYPAENSDHQKKSSRVTFLWSLSSLWSAPASNQLSLIQSAAYFQTIHTHTGLSRTSKTIAMGAKTHSQIHHTLSMAKWTIQVYRRCCHGIPITSFPAHPSE
jgi:hypothetical protein